MRSGVAWMAAAGAVATSWLTGAEPTRAQIPTLPTTTAAPTTIARTTSSTSRAATTSTPPAVTTTRRRASTTTSTRPTTTTTLSTIPPVAGSGVTTTIPIDPTAATEAGQGDMPAWPLAAFIVGVLGTVAILGAEYIRTRPPP